MKKLALAASLLCAIPMAAFAHEDGHDIADNALVAPASLVDCTLENADAAQCMSYTVKYLPEDLGIGPFCPATLDDAGGIWDWDGENAGLYRIDGAFLTMLDELGYTFFDDDGAVNVFDIRVEGPQADHECIAGSVEDTVEMTILIPIDPVMADEPTPLGTVAKVGLALDGVPIFADAPSVLDRNHMPALDTCGGHVDPGGWYHWHATATDIDTVFDAADVAATCDNVAQDETVQFAYAFDGFAIYGSREADGTLPEGLDACGGHVGGETGDYHYHASETFPNLPACLAGVVAQDNFSTTASKGIGSTAQTERRGPNFAQIAETIGVTVTDLQAAMQAEGGRDADLSKVAARLGVSVDDLQAAMPRRR